MRLQRQLRVVKPEPECQQLIKVAFATTDMRHVNQHFGSAQALAIYSVGENVSQLLEVAQFEHVKQDGNEDKLAIKIAAIEGCAVVYSQAIGASAVRQLMRHDIQPIKVDVGQDIQALISSLQADLRHEPPAWLARALGSHKKEDPSRFDMMEDEGWQES